MESVGNQLLTKAMEYLQSAEAFAKSEVPAYLQELLQFKIAEHLVYYFDDIVVSILLLIITTVVFKKVQNLPVDCRDEREARDVFKVLCVFSYIILFGMLSVGLCHTEHLLKAYKAYAAPRVYLVDYVKEALTEKK